MTIDEKLVPGSMCIVRGVPLVGLLLYKKAPNLKGHGPEDAMPQRIFRDDVCLIVSRQAGWVLVVVRGCYGWVYESWLEKFV